MNPSANSPTSDCTPPADPGSAAVVAHAAESSSGACTPTLEQFQRWLENEAHAASHAFENPDDRVASSSVDLELHRMGCEMVIAECRTATKLLMQFKLEQGV